MNQLVASWGTVDRKEKYEFKLRVGRRKDADDGAIASRPPTQVSEPTQASAAAAAAQASPQ